MTHARQDHPVVAVSDGTPSDVVALPRAWAPSVVTTVDRPRPPPGDDGARRPAPLGEARRRLRGLDGLRAVAVLAVVVFHLDFALLPGGFLGVDIFFVISGVLITNLIVTEILTTGRLRLGAFYARRARRLLPSVLLVLVAVSLAALLWRDERETLVGGLVSSLTYVTNWWLIADHQSYFASTGRPAMTQHLWSLAVEEQFYLLWPLAVMVLAGVLVRRGRATGVAGPDPGVARRARRIVHVALLLAAGSTTVMAVVAAVEDLPYGGSTSRVYFGSDTHSMGLFLGAAAGGWLALRTHERPRTRASHASSVWFTDVVGAVAVGALIWQMGVVTEFTPGLYRGGFLGFSAVALVAVLCAVRPGSRFARVLDMRPVRWVGRRSYAIYIWHWPVVVVTRPGLDVHGTPWLMDTGRIVLTLGLAALSYHFVEVPLRTGQWARWRRERRAGARRWWEFGAVVATLLSALTLWLASDPGTATTAILAGRPGPSLAPISRPAPAGAGATAPAGPGGGAGSVGSSGVPAAAAGGIARRLSVSAFGDSVLLGCRRRLAALTRHLTMDAVVGRESWDVFDDITARARSGSLRPSVVIHTGNNGVISPDRLSATLRVLADRSRVVLVNDRVPRDWQDPNNHTIDEVARHFANVVVVDWYAESAGRVDWLTPDGLHLTGSGAQAYARLVRNALVAVR